MSETVSFRVNREEQEVILKAMVESGDTKMNAHVKRIYFDQAKGKVDKKEVMLEDIFMYVRYLKENKADNNEDLIMKLLSGIYIMLRSSVAEEVKIEADKMLDVKAIKLFLEE